MALPRFWTRFGYALWLRHLVDGEAMSVKEVADQLPSARKPGAPMTPNALYRWAERDTAPDNYRLHQPLARVLGVSQAWLIDGVGEPPMAFLWSTWEAFRFAAEPDGSRKARAEPQRTSDLAEEFSAAIARGASSADLAEIAVRIQRADHARFVTGEELRALAAKARAQTGTSRRHTSPRKRGRENGH